ncbi:MAG: calcium-binding protein [Solirubrobacterales bacterium]
MPFRPKEGIALAALALAFLLALPAAGSIAAAPAGSPSCAEGPQRAGDEIVGTPCDDRIVVPAAVGYVDAGAGDDTIVASAFTAALPCEAPGVCLGVRSPVYEGGPGDDVVFGERGNDTIRGNGGNDRLFGGIGDDLLQGGPGNDFLAGGFGADSINGEEDSDFVRGDGTIDRIFDTGANGTDTLSYATGVTVGFNGGQPAVTGFPDENGERGVRLELSVGGQNGKNGIAADGGGVDEVEVGAFETIVGTPFSDWIVGSNRNETIYGGGGADLIEGGGGEDHLFGGAGGDDLDGGPGADTADGGPGSNRCQSIASALACPENATKAVGPRTAGEVSVGLMAPGAPVPPEAYLVGSTNADVVSASYGPGQVSFTLSGASFDSESDESGCEVSGATATCAVASLDSLDIAGLGGADTLTAAGFPQQTAVILLGGEGGDNLNGGEGSEDLLVDGRGAVKDVLKAGGRDDALLHSGGPDELFGGDGNDLFLSTSACDGETISGEEGVDNASWARLEDAAVKSENRGVDARLGAPGKVGRFGNPSCGGVGTPDTLIGIEDLEGSNGADTMVGDAGPNQLLGHFGPDEYFGGFGADIVLANSEDSDPVINCGPDVDSAVIDIPTPTYADAAPIECESVREGKPDDFRTITELPPPPLVVPVVPVVRPDTRAPATRITRHPAKLLTTTSRHRRVVFRFSSSERGSSFRCKLDAKPYRGCSSPRVYNLGLGRHAVRIEAIDAAGNVDRTPALFRFQIRQVRRR